MKKWWVVMGMMAGYVINLNAQTWCNGDVFYFENNPFCDTLLIDSISNPNNIWQIGVPNKQLFDSALTNPNAIVTDLDSPYPINDTSSFIIVHYRPPNFGGNDALHLIFYFQMNSDSLNDYGKIEASVDGGMSWIDLMAVDSLYYFEWYAPKPALTGNSSGWQCFYLQHNNLTYAVGYSDSLLYRFTFISDSIQNNKDGWIIDNIEIADSWEGIPEIQSNHLLHLSPNPASTELHITLDQPNSNGTVSLMSYEGKVISHQEMNSASATLDVGAVAPGMYYVLFRSEKVVAVRKVVIAR